MTGQALTVDVYSDVVCPWCYIGKGRLEHALEWGQAPAHVFWRPFHLNPTMAKPMRRVPFAGELLGDVRVRGAYAALPLEAFDRASAALEAEEQAAYLHLLRLSVGEGRNFCRIAKRALGVRLRLSERRLLRVLDALVAKGFARPLDRDNRGTLWRVYLPREAFGEPLGDDVLVGRATERWRLARETAELRREKAEAERRFVTFLSHEVKTPLVAVKQYLDVLTYTAGAGLPETARTWIARSQERLGEMLALVQDWHHGDESCAHCTGVGSG